MFPEYKNLNLSKICSEVNDFWKKENIFKKSVESRLENNRFVFYEGPPSANGLPGNLVDLYRAGIIPTTVSYTHLTLPTKRIV